MYKLSYVVRVSAESVDELKRRCDEVFDFYDDTNVKLVRPFGDMMGLHEEFLPSSKRYMNDYIQYVTSDFLAGLGFGATQKLGELEGIYFGYNVDTGRNVYLKPALASQGSRVQLPMLWLLRSLVHSVAENPLVTISWSTMLFFLVAKL